MIVTKISCSYFGKTVLEWLILVNLRSVLFMNGRIDLTFQAESVMDIVRAKTDKAPQVAMTQLAGGLLEKIRTMRQELLDTNVAQEEVNIDYPEYDMDVNLTSY